MPKRETPAQKAITARISRAYHARCSGITVRMLDLPKVMAVGRQACAQGADDQALADAVAAFVDTIKVPA